MMRTTVLRAALLASGLCVLGSAKAGILAVLVTDESGQPLTDAVVQLKSPLAANAVKSGKEQNIIQREKTFLPAVTVITAGTSITFPNEDTVRHHVYSFSPAKKFELKLYAGTPAAPVVFDKPGLVVLGCNIHDHMIAWVHVVNTPYFGKTDAQGKLTLGNVPKGTYQMETWHQRVPSNAAPTRQTVNLGDADTQAQVTLKGLLPS
ncbi:methylamine utilization protein [Macromonas nakdongensis]|uniref:methylamine utilization protein n=1 Tax=Macromonas nakdongensis TaxID=1843082 RepID=UPI0012FF2D69|nr:methylamine utilization protein [Macromonas nakdongensis]